MSYHLVGVHIEQATIYDPITVYVAWQSNLPDLPFLWRCTMDVRATWPNDAEIQRIAATGAEANRADAIRLFATLPANRLSE